MSDAAAPVPHRTPTYTLWPGRLPLLVSVPHAGTHLPEDLAAGYVDRARAVEDTDWHLDQLYAFARELGAGLIVPVHSRYLIDLNRPPENAPMYAGANNTELCPTRFFSGDPLYRDGAAPTPAQIEARRETWWRPYHEALAGELQRLKGLFGHAVLWDGHSIRSELPWLFEGRLPDLNFGTVDGRSCAPSLRTALQATMAGCTTYTQVWDGRFKGGHITRQYGRPADGIHAVQLEMVWDCYMAERPPYEVDPVRAARLRPVLQALLQTALDWRPDA